MVPLSRLRIDLRYRAIALIDGSVLRIPSTGAYTLEGVNMVFIAAGAGGGTHILARGGILDAGRRGRWSER